MLDPGRVSQTCSDVPENLKLFYCNNAVIVSYQEHHLILGGHPAYTCLNISRGKRDSVEKAEMPSSHFG